MEKVLKRRKSTKCKILYWAMGSAIQKSLSWTNEEVEEGFMMSSHSGHAKLRVQQFWDLSRQLSKLMCAACMRNNSTLLMSDSLGELLCNQTNEQATERKRKKYGFRRLFLLVKACQYAIQNCQPSSLIVVFVLITNWTRKICVRARLPAKILASAYVDSFIPEVEVALKPEVNKFMW